jgi:predicted nicotinamide N-methyase
MRMTDGARSAADLEGLILSRLAPGPATVPNIRLYMSHPGSGLSRLDLAEPPYWARPWGGGLILARYLLGRPDVVQGRRVMDLGCGCGVAAIAAALAGAASVEAVDVDPLAVAATRLNARLNGVEVDVRQTDLTAGPPPAADVVLAGDVFYAPGIAERMEAFLRRCVARGMEVLIGDPGRRDLPLERLREVASFDVPDVGARSGRGAIYRFF